MCELYGLTEEEIAIVEGQQERLLSVCKEVRMWPPHWPACSGHAKELPGIGGGTIVWRRQWSGVWRCGRTDPAGP